MAQRLPERQDSYHKECYVFIDDSNLWIEGQKVLAKELEDADRDPRFRVDLGGFLELTTLDYHISEVFLYGSNPLPNDTVKKAVKKADFQVNVYKRSGSGKEKEVDVAMASQIVWKSCKLPYKENVTFIIVTGDRDLKPAIEIAIKEGVSIQLWSWKNSLSTDFRQMANEKPEYFAVQILDSVKDSFVYTAFMSTRDKKDIDKAHAVVFKDLPGGHDFCKWFTSNYIARLMRLFYVTTCNISESGDKQDLIFEFPNTKLEIVLNLLRDQKYKPITYLEYNTSPSQKYEIACTNRFSILLESEIKSGSDEESEESEESESEEDKICDIDIDTYLKMTEENDDSWHLVLRQKPGQLTRQRKEREQKCPKSDHCPKASQCKKKHSDFEIALFSKYSTWRFNLRKTRLCNKPHKHTTSEHRKECMFAHDDSDSWCLNCRKYGHLTDYCKVQAK